MKVAFVMETKAAFFAVAAFLGTACDAEDVQPKVSKIDTQKYEVRYRDDTSLKDIAETICEGKFRAAPMGERHNTSTGGKIQVGIIRCINEGDDDGQLSQKP